MVGKLWDLLLLLLRWFLGRPALHIRVAQDNAEQEVGGLVFEAENRGRQLTSLLSTVKVCFLTPHREPRQMTFDVREGDRTLPPFEPRQFSASARSSQAERDGGWFLVYTFEPTRGRRTRIRFRNVLFDELGVVRFWLERTLFRLTGRVTTAGPMNIEEFRARERSRGPH